MGQWLMAVQYLADERHDQAPDTVAVSGTMVTATDEDERTTSSLPAFPDVATLPPLTLLPVRDDATDTSDGDVVEGVRVVQL